MELRHIELANLCVSAANMRARGTRPDIGNILPSVRARGVLVPLIVRPAVEADRFEIVAGIRAERAGHCTHCESTYSRWRSPTLASASI
jgi:ParB family chromosome partitioning protein